jgi:hypothetical protein
LVEQQSIVPDSADSPISVFEPIIRPISGDALGHASIKTTLDTYGYLFDGLDEAAADHLGATWRRF